MRQNEDSHGGFHIENKKAGQIRQMAGHAGWCVQTQNRMGGPVRRLPRKQTHTHCTGAHVQTPAAVPESSYKMQVPTVQHMCIPSHSATRTHKNTTTNSYKQSTHTDLPMRRSIFLRASDSSAEVESPITADLAVSMSRL